MNDVDIVEMLKETKPVIYAINLKVYKPINWTDVLCDGLIVKILNY